MNKKKSAGAEKIQRKLKEYRNNEKKMKTVKVE